MVVSLFFAIFAPSLPQIVNMSARREKQKKQLPQLNKQLGTPSEDMVNKKKRKSLLNKKMGENLFSLGNLVFGGVIIGSFFEKVDNPILYISFGLSAFVFLYGWAYNLYKKGLEEE